MKLLVLLWCLAICIRLSQAKNTKNEVVTESPKKETHSKSSSKNEASSKLTKNETLSKVSWLEANETVANETVNAINSQRAHIVYSAPVTDGKCDQTDIANMKKKNSHLAKRFNDKRLSAICKRQHNWNDAVKRQNTQTCKPGAQCAPPAPPERPQFTDAQRSFLTEVRACTGKKCFEGKNETKSEAAVSQEYILYASTNKSHQSHSPSETKASHGSSKSSSDAKASHGSSKSSSDTKGSHGKRQVQYVPFGKITRKEYRTLTDDERTAFHAALNALKATMIDGVSKYNLLIEYHAPSTSPGAHFGCSFLPWHRELLKQLEVALRFENSDVFLPYWDSSLDRDLPTPCDSVLFSESFAGEGHGTVTNGPFSNWRTARSFDGTNDLSLKRDCGSDGDLYNREDIDYLMTKTSFKDMCYCNDQSLEANHGDVHMYVGGYMASVDIGLAPNDPLFFMHHCFVDSIWEQWRQTNQNRDTRQSDYPSDDLACWKDYYADAPMKPFSQFTDIKNKDGLSNVYTDELYDYAPMPSCPYNCYGPYLFCSSKFNPPKCLAKIKLNGNCAGYEDQDVCDNAKCVYGKCTSV